MGIRDRLKKLEKASEDEMILVPQPDGTTAKFPREAGAEAICALIDGHDHPLAEAVRRSPDPEWQKSFYNMFPLSQDTPDLSE